VHALSTRAEHSKWVLECTAMRNLNRVPGARKEGRGSRYAGGEGLLEARRGWIPRREGRTWAREEPPRNGHRHEEGDQDLHQERLAGRVLRG